MKTKILIPVAALFALTIAFSVNDNSSQDEVTDLFVESDNIAYADTGWTCAPQTAWFCAFPGGNYITPYIKT